MLLLLEGCLAVRHWNMQLCKFGSIQPRDLDKRCSQKIWTEGLLLGRSGRFGICGMGQDRYPMLEDCVSSKHSLPHHP